MWRCRRGTVHSGWHHSPTALSNCGESQGMADPHSVLASARAPDATSAASTAAWKGGGLHACPPPCTCGHSRATECTLHMRSVQCMQCECSSQPTPPHRAYGASARWRQHAASPHSTLTCTRCRRMQRSPDSIPPSPPHSPVAQSPGALPHLDLLGFSLLWQVEQHVGQAACKDPGSDAAPVGKSESLPCPALDIAG